MDWILLPTPSHTQGFHAALSMQTWCVGCRPLSRTYCQGFVGICVDTKHANQQERKTEAYKRSTVKRHADHNTNLSGECHGFEETKLSTNVSEAKLSTEPPGDQAKHKATHAVMVLSVQNIIAKSPKKDSAADT